MNFLQDASLVLIAFSMLLPAHAQRTQSQPTTDSSAQASPVEKTGSTPVTDTSQQASPISEKPLGGVRGGLPAHTPVHVVLSEHIDSGSLKNGQDVHGRLASAITTKSGTKVAGSAWKAGTPVTLTVVSTVPAGKLNSVGEISLEVVRIGGQSVYTDILTFRGEPGHRDLPDSAPVIGTNAGLSAGAALTFSIQSAAVFAEAAPVTGKGLPGSVTALAPGSKPAEYGQPAVAAAPGSGVGADGNTSNILKPASQAAAPSSSPQPR